MVNHVCAYTNCLIPVSAHSLLFLVYFDDKCISEVQEKQRWNAVACVTVSLCYISTIEDEGAVVELGIRQLEWDGLEEGNFGKHMISMTEKKCRVTLRSIIL